MNDHQVTQLSFEKNITALLVADPYNDFISEDGKVWPRIKAVAGHSVAPAVQ